MATFSFKRRHAAELLAAGVAVFAFNAHASVALGPGLLNSTPNVFASEAFTTSYNPNGTIEFPGNNLVYTAPALSTPATGTYSFTFTVFLQGCNTSNPTAGLVFTQTPTLTSTAPLSGTNGSTSNILPQSGGSGDCFASFSILVADGLTSSGGGTLTLNAVAAQGAGSLVTPGTMNVSAEITGSSPGLVPAVNSPSSGGTFFPSTIGFQTSAHQLEITTHAISAAVGGQPSATNAVIDLFTGKYSNGYKWSEPETNAPGSSEAYVDIGDVVVTNHNYLDFTAANPYDPYASGDGSSVSGTVDGFGTIAITSESLTNGTVNGSTGLYETALVEDVASSPPVTPCPTSHTGLDSTDYLGTIGNTGIFTYKNVPFPPVDQNNPAITTYPATEIQYEVCHYGLIDGSGITPVVIGEVSSYNPTTAVSDNSVPAVALVGDSTTSLITYQYNGSVTTFQYSFADPTYVDYLRIVNGGSVYATNVACAVYGDVDGEVAYAVLFNETGSPSNPAPVNGGSQTAFASLAPHAGTLIPVQSVFYAAGLGTPGAATDANNPYLRGNMTCFAPFGVTITQVVSSGNSISNIQ